MRRESGVLRRSKSDSFSPLVKRQRESCVIADVWVLCGINDAEAEKVEVCAAVHRALDQLQTMNVPSTGPLLQGC